MTRRRLIRTGFLGRRKHGTGVHPSPLTPGAREHRIAPHVAGRTRPTGAAVMWTPGPVLDQGQVGACTGFGFTAELIAEPQGETNVPVDVGNRFGLHLYARARHLAGWDDAPYEGATVQAGAEACRDYGLITGYLWAETIDDVRDAVLTEGPVVIAIWFYPELAQTDRANNFRATPRERLADKTNVGGHCMCVIGYDPARVFKINGSKVTRPAFFIRNSWGKRWGRRWWITLRNGKKVRHYGSTGGGWMAEDQLAMLLEDWGWDNGAACLPVGRQPVDLATVLAAHPDPTADSSATTAQEG